MKQIVTIILLVSLLLTLAGCKNGQTSTQPPTICPTQPTFQSPSFDSTDELLFLLKNRNIDDYNRYNRWGDYGKNKIANAIEQISKIGYVLEPKHDAIQEVQYRRLCTNRKYWEVGIGYRIAIGGGEYQIHFYVCDPNVATNFSEVDFVEYRRHRDPDFYPVIVEHMLGGEKVNMYCENTNPEEEALQIFFTWGGPYYVVVRPKFPGGYNIEDTIELIDQLTFEKIYIE